MVRKTVQVLGHEFDCLAGHVTIAGKGSGANLRVAIQRAVANMLRDPRLHHKQTGSFKLSVVVIAETTDKRDPLGGQHLIGAVQRVASANATPPPPEVQAVRDEAGVKNSELNCGECLMEHAAVVRLNPDGTCPCCQVNHAWRNPDAPGGVS